MRQLQKGEVEIGMVVSFPLKNWVFKGKVVEMFGSPYSKYKGFGMKCSDDRVVTFEPESWESTAVTLIEDVQHTESVTTQGAIRSDSGNVWTDSHYNFDYELTPKDIEKGSLRVDAYFVNRMWKLNQADDTGAVFHCLKTLTRLSNKKNPLEREIKALFGQIRCLAKMHNVDLEGK